jgi:hypothetical protein
VAAVARRRSRCARTAALLEGRIVTGTRTTLDWAIQYAQRHLHVLPLHTVSDRWCSCGRRDCTRQGKHPRRGLRLQDATTDIAEITAWFTQWPEANIGVHCAKSGWLALDIDPRNGGNETLAALIRELGPLPETLTAQTGGGGQHLVYRKPGGTRISGELGPGVELKANGYIVVEPSATDGPYRWVSPPDRAPAHLPDAWVVRMAKDLR